ncbi:MAG: CsgG/HfaB family protein [Candidatus Marinimicrobia bacterium]|jgi:TolB-like protein|nr:CsgG/HfaB family protein [Candidatus Neomarinimicrobiota bacterium]
MRVFKQFIVWFAVLSLVWGKTPGTQTTLNAETSAQLAEGKQTVAILDFEGRGISQMEAATLTDRLMSEMVATDAVIMVERNQMNEILEEQGLQQSGCTSAECAAEVGALLGVQNMVSGSFGKLGNTYTVDAKLFSVETGATIRSASKTHKGEVDGLLTIIEIVAWELVGLQAPADLLAKLGGEAPVAVAAPPKEPRKPMSKGAKRTLWAVILIGGGLGGAYAAGLFDTPPVPLPEPPTLPEG